MPELTENVKECSPKSHTFFSLLTKDDIFLFNEGTHQRLYEKLGAHPVEFGGVNGTYFAVWAPNAERLSVIGNFNCWNKTSHFLRSRESSGIWEGFIPGVSKGEIYKYCIYCKTGEVLEKADPFAFHAETPPKSASIVWDLNYSWLDYEWMTNRHTANSLKSPISIYEVHCGSWKRKGHWRGGFFNYRELAHMLVPYVKDMGFTHIQLLPIMEHPYYPSWGYQITGYYAPTSRYGTPQDFMYFVDLCHQNGIGVILDWVPSHFPTDGHGLGRFDGTHAYEHAHPKKGYHPDWGSYIFNYGRYEVKSFLISNALYWFEKYHVDGLRVDAVASMLYLDYSRAEGEWIPNCFGGNENLEAISFLRALNEAVYKNYPDVQMIAEESTAWPMVSRPTYVGGLGFGLKWDMGWMHDTLLYFSKDPVHRKYHHNTITFRMLYAFTENYVLVLSHDEVVHGKQSLFTKMSGDEWQKFANLRLLFAYMYMQAGKKLLFMGGEFGVRSEWNSERELEWYVLDYPCHKGTQNLVRDLNNLYVSHPFLGEFDSDWKTFEWIDCSDWENSIIVFLRKGAKEDDVLVGAFNFTPVVRKDYRIGMPLSGNWFELLNTDNENYWGSGVHNYGDIKAQPVPWHGRKYSVSITLPPLGALILKRKE